MPKPYFQDLRDRVIDAVEKGAMICRAAARRYEITRSASPWRSSGSSAIGGTVRAGLWAMAAIVPRR